MWSEVVGEVKDARAGGDPGMETGTYGSKRARVKRPGLQIA